MQIELKILNKEFYRDRNLPQFATDGAAAIDLICTKDLYIADGEVKLIHTGLAIHICNPSVAALILPRSGLGSKGLILGNTVGLIDSDYQGELLVSAWNRQKETNLGGIFLTAGDRFAQLMFVPVFRPKFKLVEEFTSNSKRGNGGFGSSGK